MGHYFGDINFWISFLFSLLCLGILVYTLFWGKFTQIEPKQEAPIIDRGVLQKEGRKPGPAYLFPWQRFKQIVIMLGIPISIEFEVETGSGGSETNEERPMAYQVMPSDSEHDAAKKNDSWAELTTPMKIGVKVQTVITPTVSNKWIFSLSQDPGKDVANALINFVPGYIQEHLVAMQVNIILAGKIPELRAKVKESLQELAQKWGGELSEITVIAEPPEELHQRAMTIVTAKADAEGSRIRNAAEVLNYRDQKREEGPDYLPQQRLDTMTEIAERFTDALKSLKERQGQVLVFGGGVTNALAGLLKGGDDE